MKKQNFLTMEELNRVAHYENAGTNLARDLWLFSCFTGLAFSQMDLIQVGDIYTGHNGKQWLGLYSEYPLRFEKIRITPALLRIIERNATGKSRNEMLFAFPPESKFMKDMDSISKDCNLTCRLTESTGKDTREYNYECMSMPDFTI